MKSKTLFLFLLFFIAISLNAQTVHDPNSGIYKDIDIWFIQGYITDFLPMVRPYPVKLVNKLLDQVIENGDEIAQEKAAFYRAFFTPKGRALYPGVEAYIQGDEDERSILVSPYAEGAFFIGDLMNVSYNMSFHAFTKNGEHFNVPGTYSPYPDLVVDTANIGRFTVLQNWTSLVSFGSSDVYFQAGLSRSSFGPFYDNGVVLGPQAPRAGHFSFMYWDPLYSFEVLFQTIVATDDFGYGVFPAKYNIIHSINFRPVNNLELGVVQSLIYGERIDPLYFVPFSFLFGSQTINGFGDNALIGLHLRWKALNDFLVNGQVYIDDFSFNGILKGEPHFKAAGQLGFSFTPKSTILSRLDFDYTAVLPYMYTHWPEPETNRYNGPDDPSNPKSLPIGIGGPRIPNYLNYTHMGRSLGTDLPPNSDRVLLKTNWRVFSNLQFNVSAYLTRHGNASAGRDYYDPEYHDGSIFDYGSIDPWLDPTDSPDAGWGNHLLNNFYKDIPFLTQSVIETKLGGTFGITWTLPSSFGIFKLTGDYGIQYGWNRRLVKDNNGINHFWSFGGIWSY
ncbi:MAG: hypothetical protein FWD40_03825 [Treponema sp.]|nr:hypothetical protein [Treponema sp.]